MRRLAAAALAAALTTSGCGLGVQNMPLPGGADVGSDPITVKAQFANVLNLVPQSAVKVNDVAVGRVTKVSLPSGGWTAEVTMLVNRKVKLPANSYAQLRQSSLLGEKYIQLAGPATAPTGALADGATIPPDRTNRNPEVEEVLGALSLLLNGGGLAQLRTITVEMNNALNGNEKQIKSLLGRLTTLTEDLDSNKRNITAALDGMAKLSSTMNARRAEIGTVLDDLAPGLKVLEEQRGELVRMLGSLERLSGVAVSTLKASKDDIVADLKALDPVLRKLADSGRDLPRALQVLLTFPFTDAVLPAVKGDYLNTYLVVTAQPKTTIIPPLTPPDDMPPPQEGARAPLPASGEGN
ncbi:MCE family protein [Actinomadura flavalba]|uniref:MCE family protein n=1 Tax=Actinomadura flavalba TaxID=1120938 RepID=UPI000371B107|nr:MCE family protein [Actinomadura flavalba]